MSLADALEIVSNGAKEQGLAFGDMWGSAEAAKGWACTSWRWSPGFEFNAR